MSSKSFAQGIVLFVLLFACFASPGSAQAWSSCGNSYVVQWGDTLGDVAVRCGTTVSALYAANPWTSGYLYAGQVLAIPDGNACNCPQDQGGSYTDSYVVRPGDTFSQIARRYGVSINALWASNPYIWDINRIYPGQVIYVPSWVVAAPTTSYDPLVERSYGQVLPNTQTGNVKLINIANGQVYVSLQGTTNDGASVINEYPVEGTMKVNVPSGWYIYVAWVGGVEFSGQFQLHVDENLTMVFYPNKVVVK